MPTTTQHDSRGRFTADDDLAFAGVTRLGELLSSGQVTPRELTEFYLRRIERLDPSLCAFISVRAERALTLIWRGVCQATSIHRSLYFPGDWGEVLGWGGVGRVLDVGQSHMRGLAPQVPGFVAG